jgi:hypothetical protein
MVSKLTSAIGCGRALFRCFMASNPEKETKETDFMPTERQNVAALAV